GTLSTVGGAQWQPNNTYHEAVAGARRGWLAGPTNANFNLERRRWNGSSWAIVATSNGNTSTEAITYTGSAGYYAWRVVSVAGTGPYQFWLQKP
ncbi:MAG: hypothetical protein ABIU95_07315, partial [Burkholderiales bacterium]